MTHQPATSLPTGQKMALLMLRRNDLAEQILEHLREMSVPVPEKADWSALIEQGRVHRQFYYRGEEQHSRLALTPGGLHSAGDVMRDYARALGIHSVSYAHAVGNQGPSASCTCGWGTYQPNSHRALLTLSRYGARHIEQAREGTLPEAYRLPKFEAMEAAN